MKFILRRLAAPSVVALLLAAGTAPAALVSPVHAAAGIRALATVCDWADFEWGEMTDAEQRQWLALGWNEMRWESEDETAYPASATKTWDELNTNEQAAAWTLGYTPDSWDSETCPE